MQLFVYVPAPGTQHGFLDGSAIVSAHPELGRLGLADDEDDDGDVLVYYEGNRYSAPSMTRYGARLYHAASRLLEHYPTTSRALLPAGELVHVGYLDMPERRLTVTDEPPLLEWLGVEALNPDAVEVRA